MKQTCNTLNLELGFGSRCSSPALHLKARLAHFIAKRGPLWEMCDSANVLCTLSMFACKRRKNATDLEYDYALYIRYLGT